MSSQGPTHSLPSMAPDLSVCMIWPPGTTTTMAPNRRSTRAPGPAIRKRSPLNPSGACCVGSQVRPSLVCRQIAEKVYALDNLCLHLPEATDGPGEFSPPS
jgi:hypothetical protein